MAYIGKYKGKEIDELLDKVSEMKEIDLMDDFIPLCRDFSDDFNNDFAR
jgi:hypothetical protein